MPIRLLIGTALDLRRPSPRRTACLGLLWGLETRGIEWYVADPAAGRPAAGSFDAFLSWWGGAPGRLVFEQAVEAECAELGLPVINPLSRRRGIRHSRGLLTWSAAGIPCARCQRFSTLAEVTLDYPLVLRADGHHGMRDSRLVTDADQAQALLDERARTGLRPMTLATEFRDTRFADGLYRKRRCFVVGDRVLPRQHLVAATWKVKLQKALPGAPALAENRLFCEQGEERADLVWRAMSLLGPEIGAIDYTRLEDGSYLFWEVNAIFCMAGLGENRESQHYRAVTGRSKAECEAEHLDLGTAIADLVLERAAAGGPVRRKLAMEV